MAPIEEAVDIGVVGASEDDPPVVLGPGRYTAELLESLAFAVEEDVQVLFADPGGVYLSDPEWPRGERNATVVLWPTRGIVLPELAGDIAVRNITGPADPSVDQYLSTPIDFPTWVDAVDTVTIADEGVIEAPATTVRWWDVVVDPEAGPTQRCGADTTDCVSAFVTPPAAGVGVVPLQSPNLLRIYLFDDLPGVFGLVDAQDVEFFDQGNEIMEMIVSDLSPVV